MATESVRHQGGGVESNRLVLILINFFIFNTTMYTLNVTATL